MGLFMVFVYFTLNEYSNASLGNIIFDYRVLLYIHRGYYVIYIMDKYYLSCPYFWAFLVAQMVKNLPVMQETQVSSLDLEDLLEKGMATHCSILAWRMPWTEVTVCRVAESARRRFLISVPQPILEFHPSMFLDLVAFTDDVL